MCSALRGRSRTTIKCQNDVRRPSGKTRAGPRYLPLGSRKISLCLPLGSRKISLCLPLGSRKISLCLPLGSRKISLCLPLGSRKISLCLPLGSRKIPLCLPLGSRKISLCLPLGSRKTSLGLPLGSRKISLCLPLGSRKISLCLPLGSRKISLCWLLNKCSGHQGAEKYGSLMAIASAGLSKGYYTMYTHETTQYVGPRTSLTQVDRLQSLLQEAQARHPAKHNQEASKLQEKRDKNCPSHNCYMYLAIDCQKSTAVLRNTASLVNFAWTRPPLRLSLSQWQMQNLQASWGRGDTSLNQAGEGPRPCKLHP